MRVRLPVNRSRPAAVSSIVMRGKFINAELVSKRDHERNALVIATPARSDWCRRGLIARRSSACARGPGIGAGERIGLIRFGSRVDVYLPRARIPWFPKADRNRGEETLIADLSQRGYSQLSPWVILTTSYCAVADVGCHGIIVACFRRLNPTVRTPRRRFATFRCEPWFRMCSPSGSLCRVSAFGLRSRASWHGGWRNRFGHLVRRRASRGDQGAVALRRARYLADFVNFGVVRVLFSYFGIE